MKAITLFSFLFFPILSHAETTEELSLEIFDIPLAGLCSIYDSPLQMGGSQPVPFFAVSEKKIQLRREAAGSFDLAWKAKEVFSERTRALAGFLNESAIALGLNIPGEVKIAALNQSLICHEETEAKFGDILRNAKNEKAKQALESAMNEWENRCIERSIGFANFSIQKIYLGAGLFDAEVADPTLRLVGLHELCHIAFPGITGQNQEEVFCDAVALHWAHRLKLSGGEQNYGSRLLRNNPAEVLLQLRSRLPLECSKTPEPLSLALPSN